MTTAAVIPRDPQLYSHIAACVLAGSAALDSVPAGAVVPTYSRWPELSTFENGMPRFEERIPSSGPLDYASAGFPFPDGGRRSLFSELPPFVKLQEFSAGHSILRERLGTPPGSKDLGEYGEARFGLSVEWLATEIVGRLRHEGSEVNDASILPRYLEIEAGLFLEDLPVELVVPAICTTSNVVGRIDLGDGLAFEQLDEATQIARVRLPFFAPVMDVLLGAATHAVIIRGQTVQNHNRWDLTANPDADIPKDLIERAFTAMRIASGMPLGWSQAAVRPLGWARHWTADLPLLEYGLIERQFLSLLDNFGWLGPTARITRRQVERAGAMFEQLGDSSETVQLASRRFSMAKLRSDADDGVVDACIGIEALLGDANSGDGITSKLRVRGAFVLSQSPTLIPPSEASRLIRDVYARRSEIVHGTMRRKYDVISMESERLPAAVVAMEVLRRLLVKALRSPSLGDPTQIDEATLALFSVAPRSQPQ